MTEPLGFANGSHYSTLARRTNPQPDRALDQAIGRDRCHPPTPAPASFVSY